LSRAVIELALVFYALFNQILLTVGEHLAHHIPSYLDVSVLNEMKRYVHVVFFECGLEAGFVKSDAVKAGFGGKARVTFRILKQNLNLRVDPEQVLGAREDHFENVLIEVADCEVQIE
jgi:hypothetical protein